MQIWTRRGRAAAFQVWAVWRQLWSMVPRQPAGGGVRRGGWGASRLKTLQAPMRSAAACSLTSSATACRPSPQPAPRQSLRSRGCPISCHIHGMQPPHGPSLGQLVHLWSPPATPPGPLSSPTPPHRSARPPLQARAGCRSQRLSVMGNNVPMGGAGAPRQHWQRPAGAGAGASAEGLLAPRRHRLVCKAEQELNVGDPVPAAAGTGAPRAGLRVSSAANGARRHLRQRSGQAGQLRSAHAPAFPARRAPRPVQGSAP